MGIIVTICILGVLAYILGSLFGGDKNATEKRTIVHHYTDPDTGETRQRVEEQIVQTTRPQSSTEATKSGCSIILWIILGLIALLFIIILFAAAAH